MKAARPTRLISRILLALTLSGVLHAALPPETTKKKLRMANVEAPGATEKSGQRAIPQES